MTDVAGAAPEQTQSTGGRSLRRMVAATEIDLRLFGMLVALAAIWIGFGIVTGGKILSPASMVTLSVQTTVVAIMATGHGARHRLAQHRPLGRLDGRRHRHGLRPADDRLAAEHPGHRRSTAR